MDTNRNPLASSNGLKKSSGAAIAALLIFGAVAGVMAFHPNQAFAATSITTSSPKFFGPGFLRVVIVDTAKNLGTDTIVPLIEVKRGGTTIGTSQPTIQNIGSSGTFELFVTTSNGPLVPASPSYSATPSQTPGAGATGSPVQGPFVIRVNNNPTAAGTALGSGKTSTGATATFGANNIPVSINGASPSNLQDGDSIVITYGGQQVTAQFGRSQATISTDRVTAGDGNNIYVKITDQDAVIDPTNVDQFPATAAILTGMIGGSNVMTFGANSIFRETGQGTGAFELLVQVDPASVTDVSLGTAAALTSATGSTTPISFPQAVTFRASDMDTYVNLAANGATAPYNAVTAAPGSSTSSAAVTLQNVDGGLSLAAPATLGNGLQIKVTDADSNIDSRTRGTLAAGTVTVSVAGVTGTLNGIQFQETDLNSGIFAPLTSNNRIPINIVSSNPSVTATAINITPAILASDPDVTITYNDPAKQPSGTGTFQLVTKIRHPVGSLSGPSTVGVTSRLNLNMTAPDANFDANTVDSFVVTFPASTSTSTPVTFGNGIGQMTLKVRGAGITLGATPLILTFIETGPNTGVFVANNIDMSIINNVAALKDGDQVEFKFTDNGQSPAFSNSATLTVGKPTVNISLDRTTLPIPRPGTNDDVKLTITVTDPILDTTPSSINTPTLSPTSTPATLKIQVTKSDGSTLLATSSNINGLTDNANSQLFAGKTFTETGLSTGVFTSTLDLLGTGTGASLSDLNNAKVKFTYTDGGSTSTASFTLRAYDAVVTADKTIVQNGNKLTVTINDLNMVKDPTLAEKITATVQGKSDDQPIVTISDFTETGTGTGVFTKTLTVGKDFKIGDLTANTFSSQVQIHYTNVLASDLTTNVDRELDLQAQTQTGSIKVVPDVVGPGTKISVLVNDTDLNTNPAGVVTTSPGVEYLRITSDRTGAGTFTAAQGQETAVGSSSFKTTMKFSPIVTGQATPTNGWIGGAAGTTDLTGMFVLPGDTISVKYTDQKDASGSKVVLSKTFKIQSFDPTITSDKMTVTPGDQVKITVTDPDANVDGEAIDSVSLKVYSTTDPVGITVTALETGPNTGVFTALIPTTNSVSTGSLSVKTGDNLTVKYNDKFPADYADRVKQVVDPSKDFSYVIPVGVSSGKGDVTSTSSSNPVLKDFSNNNITEVTSGKQVVLSSTVTNNQGTVRPFAAIVEVRNADDVTTYLQWQTGSLNANGNTNIGLSWTPDAPGTYTVRTFVVTDIANPAALSAIATSTITVS